MTFQTPSHLDLSVPWLGYVAALVYALLAGFFLTRYRHSFNKLKKQRWILFAVCLITAPLLDRAFVVTIPSIGTQTEVAAGVFGFVPLMAAALWLGSGPAGLVGLVSGMTHALFVSGRLTQPVEMALVGILLAIVFNQPYRGKLARWLRLPLVAVPLVAILAAWPLELAGIFTTGRAGLLANLERTISYIFPVLEIYLLTGLIAAALFQIVLARRSAWQPVRDDQLVVAPWQKHLNRRLLYTFAPPAVLSILLVAIVAGLAGYRAAMRLIVAEMSRDALKIGALAENQESSPLAEVLFDSLVGSGEGLIIDSGGQIVFNAADSEFEGQVFSVENMRFLFYSGSGSAYLQVQADGTRQIVYVLPLEDGAESQSAVIIVPDEVVLQLAIQIAFPLLLMLTLLMAGLLILFLRLIRRITDPLEMMVEATDLVAAGRLSESLPYVGEDEIGRLASAFGKMQTRLRERLVEQERLLDVSRSVSSNLELFRAMPPILNSALDVTDSQGVRIALSREKASSSQSFQTGPLASAMAVLDEQLLDLVERQGTTVISRLWRASGTLDLAELDPSIKSLVALPLRRDTTFLGVMWVGYDEERAFEEAEMTFLSTLAGQAAVAIANAQLFAEAAEGRRRMEAVLQSTADGIVAVDPDGKIILFNPAAEKYLGVRAERALGSKAITAIAAPELTHLLVDFQEPNAVLEIKSRDSRTLLVSISTIVGQRSAVAGRVAVVRDITAIKDLDNMKTVFIRMVSHDLKSPLTYMRGYASLVPISGDLNERQKEALNWINGGIEAIAQLADRLTYLGKLQFGEDVELDLSLIDVEELIREESGKHIELARQKRISVELDIEEKLPLLLADGLLYGHAITNLIQNALKYTPDDGKVLVKAYRDGENRLSVAVRDTGIGIRKEDQGRLFEAFYRVPHRDGDPQRPSGSGIGLALVKAIAEAHDGTVGVESDFGKGSTFIITLPILNADEIADKQ
ncbi:MAG: HAMP domain-containing protein [Anaerolineae bacterium]|nr:HAMP domain-containing protein [Anaerolineae bacterium]